jgi:outer membrane lipoprotein-sorting protein
MHSGIKLALAALIALALLPGRPAYAAPAEQKDLKEILRQLDAAAAGFHSTSADIEIDAIQTEPVYDKDVQKGTACYDRKGESFRMAVHLREENGKPSAKAYIFAGGVFKLFEPGIDQVTTYSKYGKFESYIRLGFGASGKDLADKWEIKYLGSETLNGVKTEELELVAKDPEVRKNLAKVTIWIDPDRAVILKEIFQESATSSRVSLYSNIKVNQPLPSDAFTLKTDSKTQFVNR